MEMEYFCKPGTEDETFERWRKDRWAFYLKYGIPENQLKWHHHDKLAHYAKDAYDITYNFPIGFEEIEGIHSRTDFDLSQHQEYSKKDMAYIDQEDGNKKYIPYVVETSAGLNRNFLMFLCEAYEEQNVAEAGQPEDYRTVLHLHPKLAPITVAVLPLMKKDGLAEKAKEIQNILKEDFVTDYDQSGTVGKRYRHAGRHSRAAARLQPRPARDFHPEPDTPHCRRAASELAEQGLAARDHRQPQPSLQGLHGLLSRL